MVDGEIKMIKLKSLLSENNKGKLTVFHGTRAPFKTFNIKNSTQGIIWFTSNKDKIINGDAGANGKGYIITANVTINNPAGWDEYDKYSLGELKRDNYDGAILPDGNGGFDCFVFSNKQIKILGIEKDEFKPRLDETIKKPTYSAVLLDDESRELLLSTYQSEIPDGWFTIAHHMTINFKGLSNEAGTPVTLKVVALGKDDKAFAIRVEGYHSTNKIPHITIAINTSTGAKPVDSNNIINWQPVNNGITLTGTVENL